MAYKSDHGFRDDLWHQVIRGLPQNLASKCHQSLGKHYREEKDEMGYQQLLGVVQEVMGDYPEWSWNGQRWIEG